jgi:hypothetical protein
VDKRYLLVTERRVWIDHRNRARICRGADSGQVNVGEYLRRPCQHLIVEGYQLRFL